MELDTYQKNLAGLLLVCGSLVALRGSESDGKSEDAANTKRSYAPAKQRSQGRKASQWAFYVVYALVMAADWLQGPFLYSLYRDEHHVSPELISTLFTTGFLSGAVSAYFIGSLADRFGRRRACLGFCVAYALSCLLTVATPTSLPLLFAGRALGGLSTSLLFSVFESWLVTDFHARFLERKGLSLSRTFGTMSTLNSIVAIVSGVFSEWLVGRTGTRKAPFGVSVGLLGMAWVVIYFQWDENYGEQSRPRAHQTTKSTLFKTLTNKRVLSLGLASTMFEGSMYLFVFFWTPALKSVHVHDHDHAAGGSKDLPYGIIFASFMASMMASSLVFNHLMARPLLSYGGLLVTLTGASAAVFYALSVERAEQLTFWLFCVFEACVGMYWPCMGYLRGRLVDDGVRAQVYGILRIPLNVFVVVSLMLMGDGSEYGTVFLACSVFLLASSGALAVTILGEEAP